MTLAGKAYFEAVSKLGENAFLSIVSRELGEFREGPGSIVKSACSHLNVNTMLQLGYGWFTGAEIWSCPPPPTSPHK